MLFLSDSFFFFTQFVTQYQMFVDRTCIVSGILSFNSASCVCQGRVDFPQERQLLWYLISYITWALTKNERSPGVSHFSAPKSAHTWLGFRWSFWYFHGHLYDLGGILEKPLNHGRGKKLVRSRWVPFSALGVRRCERRTRLATPTFIFSLIGFVWRSAVLGDLSSGLACLIQYCFLLVSRANLYFFSSHCPVPRCFLVHSLALNITVLFLVFRFRFLNCIIFCCCWWTA